jgi:hypothetical protein
VAEHKNRRPTLEVRRLKALYARAGREAGANRVTALDGGDIDVTWWRLTNPSVYDVQEMRRRSSRDLGSYAPNAAPFEPCVREFNGGGDAAFPVPLLPRELHRERAQSHTEAPGAVHTCRQDIRLKNQARPSGRNPDRPPPVQLGFMSSLTTGDQFRLHLILVNASARRPPQDMSAKPKRTSGEVSAHVCLCQETPQRQWRATR